MLSVMIDIDSVCTERNWRCENDPEADCRSVCRTSGENHYYTFDGVHYDYEVRQSPVNHDHSQWYMHRVLSSRHN